MAASEKLLIIDGQVFQSAARDRGMGRYSEYLLKSIIEQDAYGNVIVIFSKKNHNEEADKLDLSTILPGAESVYLDLSSTTHQVIEQARKRNEQVVCEFVDSLNTEPKLIDFIIPSPFQEPIVSVFPENANKFVVFYDLIPYLQHTRYADKMPFDNYLKRFKLLFEADKILTISQSVKDDLVVYLGIPDERVVSIDGAAIRSHVEAVQPTRFVVPEKYILMPTSDDPRKNNLRAVLGFEEFNRRTGGGYKLVITSKIHPTEQERLRNFSKNILFTDNVAEEELDWLYGRSDIVLFVPESEGLGLPLLEALQVGKRVVCSAIDVFREISENAFYYCDYEDQFAIADAIESAVRDMNLPVQKNEYARVLRHYSWPETAKRAARAMNNASIGKVATSEKPKIAVFTPTPDGYSAIGKVVAEGHATLSNYFEVDYFVETGISGISNRPNYLQFIANYFPAEYFSVDDYKNYDAVFYHIGNSEYHLSSITNGLYLPGYTILHDTNISDAYKVMVERDIISQDRNELELRITAAGNIRFSKHLGSLVTNQLGIMTHSNYAANAAKELTKKRDMRIKVVNLATAGPSIIRKRDYKKINLGMAGIIADIKGIEVVERIANDDSYRKHTISIFGYNYADPETIERLTTYENVNLATNLTDLDFASSMRKLDIFVNYRLQYQGETSLSTLEAMRQGVVVFVRNLGWYAELPDDVVVKVDSIDDLIRKLSKIMNDKSLLATISERAVAYVRDVHNHKQYAEGMKDLLGSFTSDSDARVTSKGLRSGKINSKQSLIEHQEIEKK